MRIVEMRAVKDIIRHRYMGPGAWEYCEEHGLYNVTASQGTLIYITEENYNNWSRQSVALYTVKCLTEFIRIRRKDGREKIDSVAELFAVRERYACNRAWKEDEEFEFVRYLNEDEFLGIIGCIQPRKLDNKISAKWYLASNGAEAEISSLEFTPVAEDLRLSAIQMKANGITIEQIKEELEYREQAGDGDGRFHGWNDELCEYTKEELEIIAYELWEEIPT